MAFTVRQMTDEPIIIITYRKDDTTQEEAQIEARKIAALLREIGDYGYIIVDLAGHETSYKALLDTLNHSLHQNCGQISNPAKSIVIVGSAILVNYHQIRLTSEPDKVFAWIVLDSLDSAFTLIRSKIRQGDLP